MANSTSFPSKGNAPLPSVLEKIVSKLPGKFRNLLLVLLASQLVAPKDASANTADQNFSQDANQPTKDLIVEKPDSLTPPTLSSNPKSESKLPQIETITTENLVHNLDTTLSVNSGDILAGFPGKLLGFNQTISNNNYQINTWNNQSGVPDGWLVTGNGDTVIYGGNSAGWPAFKKLNDANWTQIAQTTGYGVNDLVGISKGPTTSNIDWYLKGSDKILKKTGTTGTLQEVLNLTGLNSITSNGTDTIYVSRGSQGEIRAYNVNNFSQYTNIKYNLPNIQMTSLSWKNGHLLATTGNGKSFILENGETTWTQVSDEGTGNGFATSTWLQGTGSNEFDFAVGSYTQNKVNVYREVLAPSFTSATLTPGNPLVNPGVASDAASISCNVSNKPTEVHADLSTLGGSSSVALSKVDNTTWKVEGLTFENTLPGQYTIPITATNPKGSVSTNLNVTITENGAPVWTNPVDTIFVDEDSPTSYTINSSDPNGHSVTTSYTNTPTFLSPNGATISGTPGNSNVGVHSVSGRLVDSFQDTTLANFNVKVVNKAPEFTSNPPLFGNVGTPYSYTPSLQYHNPNNPVQAVTLPPWASFNNGTLSGNPTFGTFPVVLRSDDGNGGITAQTFEIQVTDTNPFADSLRNNTNHLVSSPDSVFTVNFPKKYHNPNLTYQAFNPGTAVQTVDFVDSPDTLKAHVTLKPGQQRSFIIRVKESGNTVFETGLLTLNLDQGNLVLLSGNITTPVNVLDTVLTKVSTGAATNWKITNESDGNRVVANFNRSNTGIIEERTKIENSWVSQTGDSVQVLKIEIKNQFTGTTVTRSIQVKKALTSVRLENGDLPKEFKLEQNFPNPFNPTTKIKYALPKEALVNLKIYDMLGREVATPINNELQHAGHFEQDFDGSSLASGTYIYVLTAGDFRVSKKLVLLK